MTVVDGAEPSVRLVRRPDPGSAVVLHLDPEQSAVVGHGHGPLVVLGAPGTGKTTALVEAVAARVERDGVAPDAVLVLAPTRVAAAALRDRIARRLARTVREPIARTPHSFAFGVLRRARVLDGDAPPRLISGPEQDTVLAELLSGHEAGAVSGPTWPQSCPPEVRALRGFRDELRDLMMRAVERGLSSADLADLGGRHDRPEWTAAAAVLEEYLDVTALGTPGAYDPAAIVDAAASLLAADADLLAAERDRWALVAVDDAQESTVATERLLDVLAGGGRDLLLAGDPDAATQTFRGARPRMVADAPTRFPRADGAPATTVVLRTVHRHGIGLREVAARVSARIGSSGAVGHRRAGPAARAPAADAAVCLLASTAQEAAFVAQWLRRHHLEAGLGWDRMAVVVRSGRATEPLRRALAAAGVPVRVPTAEVAVRDERAVVPLRLALRCTLDPAALTVDLAVDLLTGPLGAVDTVTLRRLRQALRARELAAGGGRSSDDLVLEALTRPGGLSTMDPWVSAGAARIAAVLAAGRLALAGDGASAETVLWALWDAAGLADGWRRRALLGGAAGARADRDLDAVVALFEAAGRFVDRLPGAGVAEFLAYLEGQELPADTLAERAAGGGAVALVTAQGAAGREWDAVAVTGVQEGRWPDLRLRSSLLGSQALADLLDGRAAAGGGAAGSQRRAVLDDELRLFLVAVSRARRWLVVTAVRSVDDQPSPFLDLVDPVPDDVDLRPVSEVPRSMTLQALVAELRSVLTDSRHTAGMRHVAAGQLAQLARAGVAGADPADWYGLAPLSTAGPLRDPGQPVRISPSRVEAFDRCALRWLLESTGGTAATTTSQSVGILVHELAQEIPDGDRPRLLAALAERVARLDLPDGWVGDRERERARAAVEKFAAYVAGSGRELVAVEQQVEVEVGRAVVRGTVDRLERDGEGRLVVVDLKAGRSAPAGAELARHAQLGVYQLAVQQGGVEQASGSRAVGGAVLVQLGTKRASPAVQRQPALTDDPDPQWARRLVENVADSMAGASFPATGNALCRICAVRRSCPLQTEGRQVAP